jgi:hypothetical protein
MYLRQIYDRNYDDRKYVKFHLDAHAVNEDDENLIKAIREFSS